MKCLECQNHYEESSCRIFGWIEKVNSSKCCNNDALREELSLLLQNITSNGHIKFDQLNRLCQIYDIIHGDFMESEYQGSAVYGWIAEVMNYIKGEH